MHKQLIVNIFTPLCSVSWLEKLLGRAFLWIFGCFGRGEKCGFEEKFSGGFVHETQKVEKSSLKTAGEMPVYERKAFVKCNLFCRRGKLRYLDKPRLLA
ncbi:MAG: hypothetical protein KBT45_05515 [Bacteroidales bacterium]|nr:hypothetical protein [Candidatus Colimorpha pelethequi]